MKRLPDTIRILLGVSVAIVLFVCLFLAIHHHITTPNFIVSNIHYAVDTSNDTIHVTATVKNTNQTASPMCYLGALDKNSAPVGMDRYTSGPWLEVGRTWQLASDLNVASEEAAQVNRVKVDCMNFL